RKRTVDAARPRETRHPVRPADRRMACQPFEIAPSGSWPPPFLWPIAAGGMGVAAIAGAGLGHGQLGPGGAGLALLAYLVAGILIAAGFRRTPTQRRFGAANAVTLLRAAIVCLFVALLVE